MRMMMHSIVVDHMDGTSSDSHHHVVLGRMEMGRPDGLRRLLQEEEDDGHHHHHHHQDDDNRILYGQKVIVHEEENGDVVEEEEQEEDVVVVVEDEGGSAGRTAAGAGDGVLNHHHHHHHHHINNVHKLQHHDEYQEHQQGENHRNRNGGGEEEHHHLQEQHNNNSNNCDVGYGVGGPHHHIQHGGGEAKLAELGSDMLRVDTKLVEGGRDRPASDDGDVGTSPPPPGGGGGGEKSGGRGRRTSKEPPIEWSEGETTMLLQAFGDKYRALDRGNFTSKIWADIAARVNAYGMTTVMDDGTLAEGPPKTQEQCRIKVDNLKKRYKVEREKKRVSGCAISKWPFFDAIEELIGSNPRLMRGGGATAGIGGGGMDPPNVLALENGAQPLAIRSSVVEEGERIYYLEASGGGGEGDQTSETVPKVSPILMRGGKRKRTLKDIERDNANAASLRALFEGYNIPSNIIDAMVQEDLDENTLINTKDITALIDQLRVKHQLQIKLGPAERIKQAIEETREKRQTLS
ncbi:hypothetical protein BDL97_12G082200 [Sphagnum fallax]|nr:hypothetical protein BDL97_12G082200 [Sphagnum fallax]